MITVIEYQVLNNDISYTGYQVFNNAISYNIQNT